jgi:hypothetical protein
MLTRTNLHVTAPHLFLLLTVGAVVQSVSMPALAGPLIGIIGEPPTFSLPRGPFVGDSGLQNNPPTMVEITTTGILDNSGQTWTKDIVWNYDGDSISPGDRLCIHEEIVLYNPPVTTPSLFLADWHETLVPNLVPLEWEAGTATMTVRRGVTPLPISATAMTSPDGSEIWFSFQPLLPDMYAGANSIPIVLDIQKYVKYTGNSVITSGGSQTSLLIQVTEQPSTPEPGTLGLAATCAGVLAARRRRPA